MHPYVDVALSMMQTMVDQHGRDSRLAAMAANDISRLLYVPTDDEALLLLAALATPLTEETTDADQR